MERRRLGKTGFEVSVVGFGAWAIGGDWGHVDDATALATLHAAVDAGVSFIDTADVYGDGRSERLVARLCRERSEELIVATKAGRRAPSQTVEAYTPEHLEAWIDRSRENLERDRLDLVQLHCPPTDLFYHPEVFAALDDLVARGKIAHYGVSVERVEEGLKALDYPGVSTVQIIYNIVRQRPAERFLPAALAADVGVLARVPLASGLLTGKLTATSTFAPDDHRNFNRHGEAFDVGETFAGIDFAAGLEIVERLRPLVPAGHDLAELALRFCLSSPAVSTVIPGARRPEQATANAAAGALGPLDTSTLEALTRLYRDAVPSEVHYRW